MHLTFILHKFNEFLYIIRIPTIIVIFTTQHSDDAFVFIANTPRYVTSTFLITSNIHMHRNLRKNHFAQIENPRVELIFPIHVFLYNRPFPCNFLSLKLFEFPKSNRSFSLCRLYTSAICRYDLVIN